MGIWVSCFVVVGCGSLGLSVCGLHVVGINGGGSEFSDGVSLWVSVFV
jgi:hypothetical protein